MKVTILGTGHATVTKCYNTCFTISENGKHFLVDAGGGNGILTQLENANIKPENIDYINAHGTSTHLNDVCETLAIKRALGEASKKVMVSSTKGNTGHLLGAAGVVEALICAKAIEEQLVPPTLNYKVPDEECDLDIVQNEPRNVNLNVVMSNSLGFGGHNASIILKKYEEER